VEKGSISHIHRYFQFNSIIIFVKTSLLKSEERVKVGLVGGTGDEKGERQILPACHYDFFYGTA
jgi:hypothetical protein